MTGGGSLGGVSKGLATLLAAAVIVVGGIAALSSFLGGGSVGPLDPVAQAADTTAGAGAAEIQMTGQITAEGQTVPLNGSGVIDNKNSRAHMSFSTQIPGAGAMTVEEILNGTTIYMKFPAAFAAQMPGGKQWMKLDLQAFGKKLGLDFQKLMHSSPGQTNPADMLRWLKGAGDSHVVGHETVAGEDTTHYAATINLQQALDRIGDPKAVAGLKQLYSQMGVTTMPVDVWVDGSSLVRREEIRMHGNDVSMDFTIDYVKFGVQSDVTPPPDDQVFDATSLASKALAGAGSGP